MDQPVHLKKSSFWNALAFPSLQWFQDLMFDKVFTSISQPSFLENKISLPVPKVQPENLI